jgi:hypothetical protein
VIPFNPPHTSDELVKRISDAVGTALRLAQSAQDVATAIGAIFFGARAGTKTLTLGTTAPDSIQTTTPTRWLTVVESDGQPTIIAGWR